MDLALECVCAHERIFIAVDIFYCNNLQNIKIADTKIYNAIQAHAIVTRAVRHVYAGKHNPLNRHKNKGL